MQKIKENFIKNGGKFENHKISKFFVVKGNPQLNKGSFVFSENGEYPYFTRTISNNGILGYVDYLDNKHKIKGNSLAVGMIAMQFFYMKHDFYAGQFTKTVYPKFSYFNEYIAQYFITIFNKHNDLLKGVLVRDFEKTFLNIIIELPILNSKIDFEYIEKYIKEIEQEHIRKLDTYLKVMNLKNYVLTDEEKEFINYKQSNDIITLLNSKLHSVKWKEYKLEDIFEKIITKKLQYKAKKLPTEPTGNYILPCLTSSFMNQGLNYYVPVDNATILKNVISIPSNSDVYRAYFQSNDFTILSDAYAICWKDKKQTITENEYLFMTQCINMVTDLPIYSYKNKLGGWNKVKEKLIVLPEKDGKIDFEFMDKFILILKKLIVKDVVEYTNKKLLTKK